MPAPALTHADYTASLQKHLPRGRAWPRDTDGVQHALLAGLSNCLSRLHGDANGLLVDAFPTTAVDLLGEWEDTLGLDGTGSLADRHAAVLAKLQQTGGASLPYFRNLVLSFGFSSCTIRQFTFATVVSPVNAAMHGVDAAFRFTVNVWGTGDNAGMEAAVQRFKPAHTTVDFIYHLF